MGLQDIVNVQISRETAGVTQAGFGTPLILGPNVGFSGVRSYQSLPAVAEDFATSTPEYGLAQKVFSQSPRVRRVKIAAASLSPQTFELTPTIENNELYSVTVEPGDDEEVFSHTSSGSATDEEIVLALAAAISKVEVQEVDYSAEPTAGNYRLHFGTESVEVAFSDGAAQIQTKLRTLAGLSGVVVTGSATDGFVVYFFGTIGDQPTLAITENALEDVSEDPVSVGISVTTEGEDPGHGINAYPDAALEKLVLESTSPGTITEFENTANLTSVETTEAGSISDAIFGAIDADNDWYFLLTVPIDDVTVKEAAATIEALRKLYFFRNGDADVRSQADDDLASELKDLGYFRTSVFYTSDVSEFGDSGFVGRVAPFDPGSETWAFKTLAAVPVDSWTDSEKANLLSKNVNFYVEIAGVSVTRDGKVIGGEYIDVIRFIDWLQARMQEEIFGNMIRLPKIPYSTQGIAVIESSMRAVLERGVRAGGIPSSEDYSVTVPLLSEISQNDRAARRLPGFAFSARIAGAIHAVDIQGVITV